VLGHHCHRSLELLLASLWEEFEDLAHDDLAHLVFLLELFMDDVAVALPVLRLEAGAAGVDGLLAVGFSALAARGRHEIEELAHVLWIKHAVCTLLDNMEVFSLKVGSEATRRTGFFLSFVTEHEVVKQGCTNEGSCGGDSKEESLVLVVFNHFDVFVFCVLFAMQVLFVSERILEIKY